MSESIGDIYRNIEHIELYNPNTKIVIIYTNSISHMSSLQSLIENFWRDKMILNVVGILWNNNSSISGFFFNPFDGHNGSLINFSNYSQFNTVYNPKILQNLNGYTIRVHSFAFIPQLPIYLKDKSGLDDYELGIIELISKLRNFTISYYSNAENLKYGGFENGQFTGALRVIEDNLADIAVTTREYEDYQSENIIFFFPISEAQFHFVVPNNYYPRQVDVLFIFNYDIEAQILFISTCTIIVLILGFTNKLVKRKPNFIFYITFIVSLLCSVSFDQITRIPRNQRLFIVGILFMSLIITTIYTGNIINDLNSATRYNILTIKDLIETGLPVYVPKSIKKDFFAKCNDTLVSELCKRYIIVSSNVESTIESIALNRNATIFIQVETAEFYQTLLIVRETGDDTVFIVPQLVNTVFQSFICQKRSPFYTTINELLQRLLETGMLEMKERIIDRQLQQIRFNIESRATALDSSDTGPLLLFEFFTAIYILLGAYAIASVILIIELIWFRLNKKKEIKTKKSNVEEKHEINIFYAELRKK